MLKTRFTVLASCVIWQTGREYLPTTDKMLSDDMKIAILNLSYKCLCCFFIYNFILLIIYYLFIIKKLPKFRLKLKIVLKVNVSQINCIK